MRVAYDVGSLLGPITGVGRYTRELANALELRGVELVPYAIALRGRAERSVVRRRVPARLIQAVWRRAGWPSIDALVGVVDLVHATNFVLPVVRRAAGVVTVHDLSFLRSDSFPGGGRLKDLVPWSLRRAARVLVPTHAVAAELAERFGFPAERVAVTHEGVSPLFFGASPLSDATLALLGLTRPFAVAVGTIEPRKNLLRLLEAWGLAKLDGWKLAIAGPKGWGSDLPRAEDVVLLGRIGDETLPGLLAAADVFCYPSLYEGFGLPPLEAMAAGTPALVGRYPAAEEVLGDSALLVDPTDVDAIVAGLLALAREAPLRRRLASAGRARAAEFSWQRTAKATLDAYRGALAS